MKKLLFALGVLVLVGVGGWAAFAAFNQYIYDQKQGPAAPEPTACHADAKICPDGSSVGRVGPSCEFAACPAANATSSTLTTFMGGSATGLTVTVNPRELVSDSRCPQNVQCVWAGTVEVRTVLSTPVSHGELVLKLGEPQRYGDFTVTLTGVTPAVTEAGVKIPESSYRFTFEVKKK